MIFDNVDDITRQQLQQQQTNEQTEKDDIFANEILLPPIDVTVFDNRFVQL